MLLNHRCQQSQGDMAGTGKNQPPEPQAPRGHISPFVGRRMKATFWSIQVIRGIEEALQAPLQTCVGRAVWTFHPQYITDRQIALSTV